MSAQPLSPGIAGASRPRVWSRRATAALFAVLSHGTFLVAVASLFIGLRDGLAAGRLHFAGGWSWAWDTLLALQFPLLHSFFLTPRGRTWMARIPGAALGRDLAPTTYAWFAAVQILATFTLWSPSGTVWWEPHGWALALSRGLYAAAWLFLGRALFDGGLGLQTGWIGWSAVWRGRRVQYPPLTERGLFALCRQPIYLGFALTLWTGPVWTPDHLLLAAVWTSYCVVGPRHKERRYERAYGETFRSYQRRVPYMIPIPHRRRTA